MTTAPATARELELKRQLEAALDLLDAYQEHVERVGAWLDRVEPLVDELLAQLALRIGPRPLARRSSAV
jgi:hypothetical protein